MTATDRSWPTLRLVFWETTSRCNLRCAHCRRLDTADEAAAADLSTTQAQAMIESLAAFASPILVFSGGEPLMRPDLFELAAVARERGLPIALASNGALVDESMARRIHAAGFQRVSISLDGADAATHDGLRGLDGSFDAAVAALKRLRAAGVATQINCTIARHDMTQLPEVVALGERLGATAVHFFLLVPVGCGEQIAEAMMLSPREVEDALGRLADLAETSALHVKATCAPQYYRILRQRGSKPSGRAADAAGPAKGTAAKGCLAGTAVCFVSHRGEVFGCGYLPVVAGDVTRQSFETLWRDSEVFRKLRDPAALRGKCGRCEYVGLCGGCRARAYYAFGDFLAEEPACIYQPVTAGEG